MLRQLAISKSIRRLVHESPLSSVNPIRHSSNLSKLNQQIYQSRVELVKQNLTKYYPLIDNVRGPLISGVDSNISLLRVPNFTTKYGNLANGEKMLENLHLLEGKVVNIRKSSKKLLFIDLIQDFKKLQVVYSLNTITEVQKENGKASLLSREEFIESYDELRIGDSISIIGFPFRTKSGELSLRSTDKLNNLSASLLPISNEIDPASKYPNYKVDHYLSNPKLLHPLVVKHLITNSMRKFLIENHGFIEVETPIISNSANGANANPFSTTSHHVKDQKENLVNLNLRIAPELYLKKLIISGLDKIFEIGKVFRNEGVDAIHNPEFTTCEFYQSYTDLNQLIELTENMLVAIASNIKQYIANTQNIDGKVVLTNVENLLNDFKQTEQKNAADQQNIIINNDNTIIKSRYFQLLEFIPTIESQTKVPLPLDLSNLDSLKSYFEQIKLPLPSAISTPNLLNKLAGEFIEPLCDKPTMILNHPIESSPLSKSFVKTYNGNRTYEVANRFELFIKSQEYINAYEEENNPFKQTKNFQNQLAFKENSNDEEISMIPDVNFTKAMEYGMPPTGGWGCGIDRLTMLLTGTKKIDDVLSFGNLKDVIRY